MIRTFTKSNEFLWSLQNSLTNAHRKTSIIRTYTNSNTCCWSLRNKTSIIRTFWKLKTRKKMFRYYNSFILCNSCFKIFTYWCCPVISSLHGTCRPSPSFRLHLFSEIVAIQLEYGSLLRKQKMIFANFPDFFRCPTTFLSFSTQTAYLSTLIVWFNPHFQLLPNLRSPYILINMVTFDVCLDFKACC